MLKLETTTIEGYRLTNELGRGGMAVVYLGENPSKNLQKVAIKILDEDLGSEQEYRKRFKREADIGKQIAHPNIVKVFSYGLFEERQYIIMEYMDQRDLGNHLKNGRKFSTQEVINIILSVAHGLEEAHKNGVIHRDLKPQNILLSTVLSPKITDFGIAKIRSLDNLTEAVEKIMGTVLYMSPEQVKGEKDIDNRSDIYSLGVVFYELLAGYNPFNKGASTPPYTIFNDIVSNPPPVISKPGIPKYIIRIVYKCMSKDKTERFKSASELIYALRSQVIPSNPLPKIKIKTEPDPKNKKILPLSKSYLVQDATNKILYLNKTETLIGRSEINHIIIEDMYVSKNHAKIYFNGKNFVIEDLNSRNSTFVNNKKIYMSILYDGDIIKMGGNIFTFKYS
jgi:Serine/threonine protein kinase